MELYYTVEATGTSDFICKLVGAADDLKIPLTFVALIFIALLRIGGAFFPQQAQQVGEYFRGIVYGTVIFTGASWFISILWGEEWTDCAALLRLGRYLADAANAGHSLLATTLGQLPSTLAHWGGAAPQWIAHYTQHASYLAVLLQGRWLG